MITYECIILIWCPYKKVYRRWLLYKREPDSQRTAAYLPPFDIRSDACDSSSFVSSRDPTI